MNRPTHLPKRQPAGCAAVLTVIAAAPGLPQPVGSGGLSCLAARSRSAGLAVTAIRDALREPSGQAAMTAPAGLRPAQINQIGAVQPPVGAGQGAP